MATQPLKNKTAVVTGGAGGIGKAISSKLAEAGCSVVILGRDSEKGAEVVSAIEEAGGRAFFLQTDLSNPDDIESSACWISQEFGGADILINNAALSGYMGPVMDTPRDEAEKTIAVNLISPFHLSKLLLPRMVQNGYGRIINVSSVAYRHNTKNSATYNMSKAGLNSLTKTLSNEVASQGITVNGIAPGLVLTDRVLESRVPGIAEKTGSSEEEVLERMASDTPSGRFTQPEEVADLVMFLTSSTADNITGEIVNIAGGF